MLFRCNLGRRTQAAVVVQTDLLNRLTAYGNVAVVPVTTKNRPSPTYVRIEPGAGNQLERASWAVTNQVFTVARASLDQPIGRVSEEELRAIKGGLKLLFAIK